MSDEAVRSADREAAQGGLDEAAEAQAARTRDGLLPAWRVQLAAYCGHAASRRVLGWEWGDEGAKAVPVGLVLDGFQMHAASSQGWVRQGPEGWFRGLLRWGLVPPMLGAAAAAVSGIEHVQHMGTGGRTRTTLQPNSGGMGCVPGSCICSEAQRRIAHVPVVEVVDLVRRWAHGIHGGPEVQEDEFLAVCREEESNARPSAGTSRVRAVLVEAAYLSQQAAEQAVDLVGRRGWQDAELGLVTARLHDRYARAVADRSFGSPEMDKTGLVAEGLRWEVIQTFSDVVGVTEARWSSKTDLLADAVEARWAAGRAAWKVVEVVASESCATVREVVAHVAQHVSRWALDDATGRPSIPDVTGQVDVTRLDGAG